MIDALIAISLRGSRSILVGCIFDLFVVCVVL